MKRVYETHFDVTGAGPFPVEMLMFDCCYPRSMADAGCVKESFTKDQEWSIGLIQRTMRPNGPSVDAWERMGVKISNIWREHQSHNYFDR